MSILKTITTLTIVAVMFGCGGGTKDTTPDPKPPQPTKSYGVFRKLTPKAPSVQGVKEGVQLSATSGTVTMTSRNHHRAILMTNGKVLLVGGDNSQYDATMDIYDPATETFTKSAAKPKYVRVNRMGDKSFAITNLPDGRVAICGVGYDYYSGASLEIYNPVDDTISEVKLSYIRTFSEMYSVGDNELLAFGPNGILVRINYITGDDRQDQVGEGWAGTWNATTLQDNEGGIWLIGGLLPGPNQNSMTSRSAVYRYNKTDHVWVQMASMSAARHDASVILLPGNKIGVYGGSQTVLTDPNTTNPNAPTTTTRLDTTEIYDIATNTWTASEELVGARTEAGAVLLQTGYTLIAGGRNAAGTAVDSELVHKSDTNFSGSTGLMTRARAGHCVTALNNGLVLISGGFAPSPEGEAPTPETAEVYDAQSKLYISYRSEQIVTGSTLQLATAYAAGVTWSLLDATTTYGSIDENGLLTALAPGAVEVKAVAKDDATLTAVIRITILPN